MKPSRQQSLDVALRDAVTDHLMASLGKGSAHLPRLRIPRVGAVDVVLGPQSGITVIFVQRSDHLAAYKHLVGQLVGCVAHLNRCKPMELRQALEKVKGFKGMTNLDVPEVAKRLIEDAKAGKLSVVIATEKPEVPQTYDHLVENFQPVLRVMQAWADTPVKNRKLCSGGVDAFVVEMPSEGSPTVRPLFGKDGAGAPSPDAKKKTAAKAAKKATTKKKVAKKKATKKA